MAKLLTEQGYEVNDASDGLNIATKYQDFRPDLVLCDVTLPEKDGIEIVKDIMATDECAKVVMLTGIDEDVVLLEAMRAGAKDCMLKPIEKEALIQTIERVLKED